VRLGDFGWDWDCSALIGLGFKVNYNQFIKRLPASIFKDEQIKLNQNSSI
jgi:hypothetical protein